MENEIVGLTLLNATVFIPIQREGGRCDTILKFIAMNFICSLMIRLYNINDFWAKLLSVCPFGPFYSYFFSYFRRFD